MEQREAKVKGSELAAVAVLETGVRLANRVSLEGPTVGVPADQPVVIHLDHWVQVSNVWEQELVEPKELRHPGMGRPGKWWHCTTTTRKNCLPMLISSLSFPSDLAMY